LAEIQRRSIALGLEQDGFTIAVQDCNTTGRHRRNATHATKIVVRLYPPTQFGRQQKWYRKQ
jgi:hypothetical protein